MKHKDWAQRLNDYLKANINTPFEWGEFDCCLHVANAVEAMTGNDFAKDFRGRYSTALGAQRALKKYGKGNIHDTLEDIFGYALTRLLAGRGSIVLVDTPEGDALGIVWAGKIWVAMPQGLGTMPLRKAKCCWEVPCHQ